VLGGKGLFCFMVNLSLVLELTKRDYRERYAGSVFGTAWAFIKPLVPLFIYIGVFGKLMGARMPDATGPFAYSIYVASGLVAWVAFSGSVLRGASVFLEKRHIIAKVQVSLPTLLVFINLAEIVTYLITMAFFLLFLLCIPYQFSWHILLLPLIFYLQQILAFGLGMLAAVFVVFLRDLKEFLDITMQLWFWTTPIVYVKSILPERVAKLIALNPFTAITDAYHAIFVYKTQPDFGTLLVVSVIAHLVVILAYYCVKSLEMDIRDVL
jgi:lipopolysaccharide transport system permease protein